MGRARVRRERRRVARFVNTAHPLIRPAYAGVSRRKMISAIIFQDQLRAVETQQDARYFIGFDLGLMDRAVQTRMHLDAAGGLVIDDVQVIHHELEHLEATGAHSSLKSLAADPFPGL